MATKLSAPVKRDTGIVLSDDRANRKLEVILRLNANGKPEIAFHLKGLKSDCSISVEEAYERAAARGTEFEPLEKPFKFRTANEVKDGGKTAPLNITVYPDDTILVRHGSVGNAVSLTAGALYNKAVVQQSGIAMPKARKK